MAGAGGSSPVVGSCADAPLCCGSRISVDGAARLGDHLSTALSMASRAGKLAVSGVMESVNAPAKQRSEGLLRALIMVCDDGPAIVVAARNLTPNGLLLNAPRGNLLRFMPALNVTPEEIEVMRAQLD